MLNVYMCFLCFVSGKYDSATTTAAVLSKFSYLDIFNRAYVDTDVSYLTSFEFLLLLTKLSTPIIAHLWNIRHFDLEETRDTVFTTYDHHHYRRYHHHRHHVHQHTIQYIDNECIKMNIVKQSIILQRIVCSYCFTVQVVNTVLSMCCLALLWRNISKVAKQRC